MKKVLRCVYLGGVILALVSCTRKEESGGSHAQADAMYEELVQTYHIYADSLHAISASDTLSDVDALISRFEQRVTTIYNKYPPATDYYLTPDQNDTLWYYASKCIRKKGSLQDADVKQDSLPGDSVGKQIVDPD